MAIVPLPSSVVVIVAATVLVACALTAAAAPDAAYEDKTQFAAIDTPALPEVIGMGLEQKPAGALMTLVNCSSVFAYHFLFLFHLDLIVRAFTSLHLSRCFSGSALCQTVEKITEFKSATLSAPRARSHRILVYLDFRVLASICTSNRLRISFAERRPLLHRRRFIRRLCFDRRGRVLCRQHVHQLCVPDVRRPALPGQHDRRAVGAVCVCERCRAARRSQVGDGHASAAVRMGYGHASAFQPPVCVLALMKNC
jgi:hypothetical protein